MKALLLLLLLLLPALAQADRTWRTGDTVREAAWQVLNLADMGTTLDAAWRNEAATSRPLPSCKAICYAPAKPLFRERNLALGDYPSRERVVAMMAAGAVAHAGISYLLPHGWREAWQYVTILESGYCVKNNISIGLKVRF